MQSNASVHAHTHTYTLWHTCLHNSSCISLHISMIPLHVFICLLHVFIWIWVLPLRPRGSIYKNNRFYFLNVETWYNFFSIPETFAEHIPHWLFTQIPVAFQNPNHWQWIYDFLWVNGEMRSRFWKLDRVPKPEGSLAVCQRQTFLHVKGFQQAKGVHPTQSSGTFNISHSLHSQSSSFTFIICHRISCPLSHLNSTRDTNTWHCVSSVIMHS